MRGPDPPLIDRFEFDRKSFQVNLSDRIAQYCLKTGYGLDRIRARLKGTSETWIASIILVLNLVKLAGAALPCWLFAKGERFSAHRILYAVIHRVHLFVGTQLFQHQISDSQLVPAI